ncbi:MAG: hypothetical protein IK062_00280 [Selenomonadaceae bacterium]|nr:hypothetical protein [Selenomonadaceae bacterium]
MRGTDLNKLIESLERSLQLPSQSQKKISKNELSLFIESAVSIATDETVRFVFLTPIGTIEGNCTNHSANMDNFIILHEVDFTDNTGKTAKFEMFYLRADDVVALSPIRSVSTEALLAWHSAFEASEVAD